ncbi:MAG TPA: FtsX-like permease family protein, partial [Longimicrobiales bacterium]|nr:FtsX-like permease family protein [Longimicrobiales bacterium]
GSLLLGRIFNESDDDPGSPDIALLSHGLWSRAFGSEPSIVGRTIELNGNAVEVVGVMPAGFRDIFQGTELWFPLRIDESLLPRTNYSYPMIGRLADGATVASASREVNALELQLPEVYPGGLTARMLEDADWSADVNPLQEDIVGDLARTLWILLGSVGLVLLIACANVANLFLVRAEARQREMAVRAALGAGRKRMAGHVLIESLTLALVSGALGLLLASGAVHGVLALSPSELPRADGVGLGWPVVGFTVLVSVVAGLVFGAVPVAKHLAMDVPGGLKEGGRGGSDGRETHRLRFVLVAGQVGLAAVLLVASGLLLRSFQGLRHVDPGFAAGGVL